MEAANFISSHEGTPVAPQVHAEVEGWRRPKVQRSKEPSVEMCALVRQYAKEHSLGYIDAATATGKLTPRQRSSGHEMHLVPWCT